MYVRLLKAQENGKRMARKNSEIQNYSKTKRPAAG
jgi:hypothetical protein